MTSSSPTFAEAMELIDGVEGWLSPDQAERLWNAAKPLGPGAKMVEIGSFRGRSAVILATAAGPETSLVAIDPYAGNDRGPRRVDGITVEEEAKIDFKEFNANLTAAGVRDRVEHIRKFSDDAIDDIEGPIDLLYIDGAHDFKHAAGDIRAYGPLVRPGSSMLIHDSFSSVGVTLATLTDLVFSKEWRYLGRSRSLTEYRRERVRGLGRITNAVRQLTQLPWFARNIAVKILLLFRQPGLAAKVFRHTEDSLPY